MQNHQDIQIHRNVRHKRTDPIDAVHLQEKGVSIDSTSSCIEIHFGIGQNDFAWKPTKRFGLMGATQCDVKVTFHVRRSLTRYLSITSEKHEAYFMNEMEYFETSVDELGGPYHVIKDGCHTLSLSLQNSMIPFGKNSRSKYDFFVANGVFGK